jgi:hypothetical protein
VQQLASSSKDMMSSGKEMFSAGRDKFKQSASHMADTAESFSDSASRSAGAFSDSASRTAGSFSESASHAAGTMADQARASGESVRQMADTAVDMGRDTAHRIGETASDYADSARRVAHDTSANVQRMAEQAQRTWQKMADEQPLVIGALGVALGALLGAGLPSTKAENRLMGEASDALKETAMGEASRQYEQVKDVATETYEHVAGEIKEKGLSTESAKHAVDKIGAAATRVADQAKSEVERDSTLAGQPGRSSDQTDRMAFQQTPGSTERSRT